MTDDERSRVQIVIARLMDDPVLDAYVAEVEFLALDIDDDTPRRLREFYAARIDSREVDFEAPREPLSKFVTIDRFLMNYASEDVRLEYEFLPRNAYRRRLLTSAQPLRDLTDDFPVEPDRVVIPAPFSWLIPDTAVVGQTADELIGTLRLEGAKAPLVAIRLGLSLMVDAGVGVRKPCALDTIPAMDVVWRRGAVAEELIDHDVPRRACEGLAWLT